MSDIKLSKAQKRWIKMLRENNNKWHYMPFIMFKILSKNGIVIYDNYKYTLTELGKTIEL